MCGVMIIMGAGYNLRRVQSLSPKKIFGYIMTDTSLNYVIISLFRNLGKGGAEVPLNE